MNGTNNPHNAPKQAPETDPKDPPKRDIPPDRRFPEKPDWLPQDPPYNEPPEPKIPEVEPPPTEDPSHDPGTPHPSKSRTKIAAACAERDKKVTRYLFPGFRRAQR